jgi:UDP-3-O-[3-hydroxymyristoyl] glucosamine N-acyltransferase
LTDDRFFRRSAPIALGEIAAHVGGELVAPATAGFLVRDVAALDCAKTGELSLFCDGKRTSDFANNHASVVVTNRALSGRAHNGSWLLLVSDPRLAFAKIGHLFYPPVAFAEGVHASAQVSPTASIGEGTLIGSGAVVGCGADIGARCRIDSNAVICDGVAIGDDCVIGANSSISHAVIGARVRISSNVSIGGEGFGFVPSPTGLLRIAQLGRVIIEDDVQIGSNSAVDRGAMGDTIIGAGTAIDNLVQIAHNVRIGRHCVLAGQVGIAGSTTLGDRVMVGGQTAINDHVTIGSDARIAGKSGVMRDVAPGEAVGGYPAMPIRQWHRQTLALAQLAKREKH